MLMCQAFQMKTTAPFGAEKFQGIIVSSSFYDALTRSPANRATPRPEKAIIPPFGGMMAPSHGVHRIADLSMTGARERLAQRWYGRMAADCDSVHVVCEARIRHLVYPVRLT